MVHVIVLEYHRRRCQALQTVRKQVHGPMSTCWGLPTLQYLYMRPNGEVSSKINLFLVWKCMNSGRCPASVAIAVSAIEEELKVYTKWATPDAQYRKQGEKYGLERIG